MPTLSVVPMHRLGALATRVGQSIKLHGAAIASGTDTPLPPQLHVRRPLLTYVNPLPPPVVCASAGCAITFLEPHDDLQYSWTQLEGPAFQVNDDTSNTPVLYMGPGTLKANQTYTLNLRAQHASYTRYDSVCLAHSHSQTRPSASQKLTRRFFIFLIHHSFLGETQVELSVIPTSPFTEIGGSALRAFPLTRDPRVALVLDASSSVDFDGLAGEFGYHWYATPPPSHSLVPGRSLTLEGAFNHGTRSCTNTATEEDCWYSGTDEYYLVNAARLVIPSYELPIGEFLFSVTAVRLSRRSHFRARAMVCG